MNIKDNVSGKADSLSEIVEYALLYDFYGALLKDKNRSIFEDYMFNDMTLSEIAEERKITRQGVRDIVNRSKISLSEYENRLGLIKRFNKVKKSAGAMKKELAGIKKCIDILAGSYSGDNVIMKEIDVYMDNIDKITEDILEEF